MLSPALLLFLLPLGLFLVVCGLGMYTGKWPVLLAVDGFFPGQAGLAATYIGACMVLATFSPLWLDRDDIPVLQAILSLVSLLCMIIGLVGCFWMPRFMQPGWMKEMDEQMARGEDLYSLTFGPKNGTSADVGDRRETGHTPPS